MKIIAISDLHGDVIPPNDLPDGDVLVIAGDVLPDDYKPVGRDWLGTSRTIRQMWWYDDVWLPYLESLTAKFDFVLWIGGNHDFYLQAQQAKHLQEMMPKRVEYLCESWTIIDGVKFYGAPWNCTAGWAFYLDDPEGFDEKLPHVPDDTDVLVVHGPPKVDRMPGFHWCSHALSDWVATHPLKAVICGHIHEAYGEYRILTTPVHVVSSKNRNYELVNPPVEIEI